MPKLTQIPKPKPTLVQIPRSRLLEIPKPKPSLLVAPKRDPVVRISKPIAPRSPSPEKKPRRTHEAAVKEPALSSPSPTASLQSVASSSVISEDIEPPDTLDDESIDNLIGHDLEELNRLISSGREAKQDATARRAPQKRSPTSEEMTAALRQSTRFRTEKVDRKGFHEPPKPSASRRAFPSFKLQTPTRRKQIQDDDDDDLPPPPPPDENDDAKAADDEDSFVEEILKLRLSARKQKETEIQKNATQQNSPEAKEISAETTANIREVSNTIDQVLLLALQPFEKRRRDMDTDDAAAATKDSSSGLVVAMQNAALPLATQAIVESLDLAFGSMTQQRNAELKAEKDAEAAAKAAEEVAKKEADAKKLEAERAEKQRQTEILSLLPMRGKLLTSSTDVDTALYRLELAENQASHTIHVLAGRAAPESDDYAPPVAATGPETELAKLRQHTMHRIQQIERQLQQSTQAVGRVNWDIAAFESTEHVYSDEEEQGDSDLIQDSSEPDSSFHDILQRQVVENLDLTMLKLRHVLGIDQKEAAAAKEAAEREATAKHKKQIEEERENARKKQETEDAENARKRVMGLTSLDQLSSWVEEDTQLREELTQGREVDRLISSLGIRADTLHRIANTPSGLGTRQALERFDAIREIMESDIAEPQHVPDDHHHEEQRQSSRNKSSQRRHHAEYEAHKQLDSDLSSDEDNPRNRISSRRVQLSHAEPEDDTPSFQVLSKRFRDASRSKRLARYDTQEEPPSPLRHGRHTHCYYHEAPSLLETHPSRSKTPSEARARRPRHSTRTPSPVQKPSSSSHRPTPESHPPSSRQRHLHDRHRPTVASESTTTHLRKTSSRSQRGGSSSLLMNRVQQQIASLQADRRQKNAWVSQRVA
ncbi:hypothetical protein Gpo141_00013949 [Globisporangium polare]